MVSEKTSEFFFKISASLNCRDQSLRKSTKLNSNRNRRVSEIISTRRFREAIGRLNSEEPSSLRNNQF